MSKSALAATLGLTMSELSDYRYQDTKNTRAVYAIGNDYFICGKRNPGAFMDMQWSQVKDQFFAEQAHTVIWTAKSDEEPEKPFSMAQCIAETDAAIAKFKRENQ